jgi:hypothetical protein
LRKPSNNSANRAGSEVGVWSSLRTCACAKTVYALHSAHDVESHPLHGCIFSVRSEAVFLLNATNSPYAPPANRRADGAFAYIKSHNLEGPVMNTYDFGGPLILNNIKTFIDGRAEQLFLGDFMKNYIDSGAAGGEKQLETILETYKIAWTMLVPGDLRNQFLAAMPEWKKTYADEYTVIFERN